MRKVFVCQILLTIMLTSHVFTWEKTTKEEIEKNWKLKKSLLNLMKLLLPKQ